LGRKQILRHSKTFYAKTRSDNTPKKREKIHDIQKNDQIAT
jgi:hypothetical protein